MILPMEQCTPLVEPETIGEGTMDRGMQRGRGSWIGPGGKDYPYFSGILERTLLLFMKCIQDTFFSLKKV